MTWLLVLILAAAAFAAAAFVLKMPRGAWTLFAAALLFGLTGYALQASPDLPSAPSDRSAREAEDGSQMIEARLRFGRPDRLLPRELITADSLTRRGQFANAAAALRSAVERRPQDAELWLALAMNLVAHAEGRLTPPAEYAFERAEAAAPGQVAAGFFRGAAMLGQGQLDEGRSEWARALGEAQGNAWGRAELQARLAQLDAALAQRGGQGGQ